MQLSVVYARVADAAQGPLTGSDFGLVVDMDNTATPFRVRLDEAYRHTGLISV